MFAGRLPQRQRFSRFDGGVLCAACRADRAGSWVGMDDVITATGTTVAGNAIE
ncbi:hypothetical protein ABT255_40090 [Streptomyces mirabilis]|uniref:hypothetical protein n=1 Tax=Streptomyces mirabilis TaxID=68239 RepID=UPI00332B5E1C